MDDLKFRLENQLCFPLYAAARKVTNLYTPSFRRLGLTYTQYIVFLVLWEEDGLSVGDIGHRLFLDNGTLTPLLKKMEQTGYVRRIRSEEDERIVHVFLTEKGRSLKNELQDVPGQVGSCIPLTPEEAVTLYQLLYKILAE
ncbi:MAG: MarR family transcriptional regulator [Firmicutes bacterium]|nr:MarR family transcriptional regulator [Bacillota bacterium]